METDIDLVQCETLGDVFFHAAFDPNRSGTSMAALVRVDRLVADVLNAAANCGQLGVNLIKTACRLTETPHNHAVSSAITNVLSNTVTLLGIKDVLDRMKGADLLRGIATVASAVSAHGHMHEFLLHVLSHVRLEEGGTANSHGRDDSVAGPGYSQEDLDAALDAIDALAKCVKCQTALFDDFVRDITSHATRSPVQAIRLAKILPRHPAVTALVAELAGNGATYALSSTASLFVSLARFTQDVPALRRFSGILTSPLPLVAGRLAMLDRVSLDKQPHILDVPDARALCSVVGWDIDKAMSLLDREFPSNGLRGRVATFLLYAHLAAEAPVASDQAGQLLVGALRAVAGHDLGIFTPTVAAALRRADFSPAFFAAWFASGRGLEGLRYDLVGETANSFLAKHRPALARAVSHMPSPDAVLRRLNLRSVSELYAAENSATAEMCLTRSALSDAERPFAAALDTHLDTVLCTLHSNPARFQFINALPPTIHPNSIVSFVTSAPAERVAEITPHLLDHMHGPGTAFTLAVLILSRARELHAHPTLLASLLPHCGSNTIPPSFASSPSPPSSRRFIQNTPSSPISPTPSRVRLLAQTNKRCTPPSSRTSPAPRRSPPSPATTLLRSSRCC